MIPLGPVVARSRVRASRAAVWATVIDPELRHAWWPELELEPRLGGSIAERWTETSGETAVTRDASGDVDVWVEGHAIGFRWSEAGDEHSTAVLVTLRSQGPETGITVTETGFDVLPSAAERAAASQDGWQVLLADLVASVEAAVAAGAFVEESAAVHEAAAENAVEESSEVEEEDEVEVALDTDTVAEVQDDVDAEVKDDVAAEIEVAPEDVDDASVEAADELTADPDDEASKADAAEESVSDGDEVSNETVKIERLVLPSSEQRPESEVEADSVETPDAEPEEPDFDTLIRGPEPR